MQTVSRPHGTHFNAMSRPAGLPNHLPIGSKGGGMAPPDIDLYFGPHAKDPLPQNDHLAVPRSVFNAPDAEEMRLLLPKSIRNQQNPYVMHTIINSLEDVMGFECTEMMPYMKAGNTKIAKWTIMRFEQSIWHNMPEQSTARLGNVSREEHEDFLERKGFGISVTAGFHLTAEGQKLWKLQFNQMVLNLANTNSIDAMTEVLSKAAVYRDPTQGTYNQAGSSQVDAAVKGEIRDFGSFHKEGGARRTFTDHRLRVRDQSGRPANLAILPPGGQLYLDSKPENLRNSLKEGNDTSVLSGVRIREGRSYRLSDFSVITPQDRPVAIGAQLVMGEDLVQVPAEHFRYEMYDIFVYDEDGNCYHRIRYKEVIRLTGIYDKGGDLTELGRNFFDTYDLTEMSTWADFASAIDRHQDTEFSIDAARKLKLLGVGVDAEQEEPEARGFGQGQPDVSAALPRSDNAISTRKRKRGRTTEDNEAIVRRQLSNNLRDQINEHIRRNARQSGMSEADYKRIMSTGELSGIDVLGSVTQRMRRRVLVGAKQGNPIFIGSPDYTCNSGQFVLYGTTPGDIQAFSRKDFWKNLEMSEDDVATLSQNNNSLLTVSSSVLFAGRMSQLLSAIVCLLSSCRVDDIEDFMTEANVNATIHTFLGWFASEDPNALLKIINDEQKAVSPFSKSLKHMDNVLGVQKGTAVGSLIVQLIEYVNHWTTNLVSVAAGKKNVRDLDNNAKTKLIKKVQKLIVNDSQKTQQFLDALSDHVGSDATRRIIPLLTVLCLRKNSYDDDDDMKGVASGMPSIVIDDIDANTWRDMRDRNDYTEITKESDVRKWLAGVTASYQGEEKGEDAKLDKSAIDRRITTVGMYIFNAIVTLKDDPGYQQRMEDALNGPWEKYNNKITDLDNRSLALPTDGKEQEQLGAINTERAAALQEFSQTIIANVDALAKALEDNYKAAIALAAEEESKSDLLSRGSLQKDAAQMKIMTDALISLFSVNAGDNEAESIVNGILAADAVMDKFALGEMQQVHDRMQRQLGNPQRMLVDDDSDSDDQSTVRLGSVKRPRSGVFSLWGDREEESREEKYNNRFESSMRTDHISRRSEVSGPDRFNQSNGIGDLDIFRNVQEQKDGSHTKHYAEFANQLAHMNNSIFELRTNRWLETCLKDNIKCAIAIYITRPSQRYIMSSMVVMRAGSDEDGAGVTYIGPTRALVGQNAKTFMIHVSASVWVKSIVSRPDMISIAHNVMSRGTLGGVGCNYWDARDEDHVVAFSSGRMLNDMFFYAIPGKIGKLHFYSALQGRFSQELLEFGAPPINYNLDRMKDIYAKHWGIPEPAGGLLTRTTYNDPTQDQTQSLVSDILFNGHCFYFNHDGNGRGGYDNYTVNRGMWGSQEGIDCDEVRSGHATYFPKQRYLETNVISEAY